MHIHGDLIYERLADIRLHLAIGCTYGYFPNTERSLRTFIVTVKK